jgi:selenide,water dikinase
VTGRRRLLLVGGGHSHVEVLRRLALLGAAPAEVTLVTPELAAAYSGMLPGVVAGHYREDEASLPLPPLARAARTRFVADRVVALDLHAREATLASGTTLAFDILSLDVGSTPDASTPGAREHAIGVKPVPAFLSAWARIQQAARAEAVRSIAVVGGGAGGVEILLAMHYRLHADLGARAPRFILVTDQPVLLPSHAPAVRRRIRKALAARSVDLRLGSAAVAVHERAVILSDGSEVDADSIVWATSAAAWPWLAACGLATDDRGFVFVDPTLRSTSHPFVFAAGDCATLRDMPHPKSGLYAVRHGPPLAANLIAQVRGGPLVPYRAQRRGLALIATGGRDAILSWDRWAAQGAWAWHWKDRIDRRFIARYAAAETAPPAGKGADAAPD